MKKIIAIIMLASFTASLALAAPPISKPICPIDPTTGQPKCPTAPTP